MEDKKTAQRLDEGDLQALALKSFQQNSPGPAGPSLLSEAFLIITVNGRWRFHWARLPEKVEQYLFGNLCTRLFRFSEKLWRVPGIPGPPLNFVEVLT